MRAYSSSPTSRFVRAVTPPASTQQPALPAGRSSVPCHTHASAIQTASVSDTMVLFTRPAPNAEREQREWRAVMHAAACRVHFVKIPN